ncbi:hypothetical protein BC940DRAFT_334461 [Gongronella butleri]|nr:hypothetical protein BC940DRAFT_334461 [Gongronella butleri]
MLKQWYLRMVSKWKKKPGDERRGKAWSFSAKKGKGAKKSKVALPLRPLVVRASLFDPLAPYQVNCLLGVTVLLLLTVGYVAYQCGRVLGLLEVVLFGCNDLVRGTFHLLRVA